MRTDSPKLDAVRRLRWLAAACLVLLAVPAAHAQVAAGYSEYYIPGDEDTMRLVLCSQGATACGAGNHTRAGISITAWSDNTAVYYDHWENGFNFNPDSPTTADETLTLALAGNRLVLEGRNINIPRNNAAPNPPTSTCDNYRNNAPFALGTTMCYDGRDRIYVAGGVVTITRVGWIEERGVGLQGVAWEIYPVKPQLTTYVVPFGETSGWYGFQRVNTLVQATRNNTTITVDLDHNGTADPLDTDRNGTADASFVTLQAGQTFLLDDTSADVAAGALAAGAVITGTDTLQVKYVAGRTNVNNCTRGFSAFPRGFWTSDYYAPLDQPGDDVNGQGSHVDYYLYNPQPSSITIDWQGQATSGSFPIAANAVVSFRTASGGAPPAGSGLYLRSRGGEAFWGVGSNDADNFEGGTSGYAHEWGYSLLPSTMLYTEHFLGWAPGGLPLAAGQTQMGVFITPAQDNTRVFADFSNDGTVDQTYTLSRLQTQYVADPDGDLSGARFWATGPFSMAYGQNSENSDNSSPALDLGYVAIPGTDFISLVLGVDKSVSPQLVPTTPGSTSDFTIRVSSQRYTVSGVNITDYLPTGWQYVDNSTTIIRPDKTPVSGSGANPTITGTGPYTLAWSSSQIGGDMAENQEIVLRFTARTTTTFSVGDLSQNRVLANGTRVVGGVTQFFNATDFAFVTFGTSYGAAAIDKTSNAGTPLYPGDTFTYTTRASVPAGSATTLTGVSLLDPIPSGVRYVAGSGSVSCETAAPSNVRDTFSIVAYNNTNGSVNWSANPWTETDSLGGGATSGLALVTGNALRLGWAENVRDEFAAQAYTNNGPNNSANWAGNWTETDGYAGGATGATGGFSWVSAVADQLQFRYLLSNVRDSFNTNGSYAGSNGSNPWIANWCELNDGAGCGSASTQDIRVQGNHLAFRDSTDGNESVYREATFTNATSVTVSFYWDHLAALSAANDLIVEYSSNGGTSYTTLFTLDGGSAAGTRSQTFPWTPTNTTIRLRFRATTAFPAGAEASFDDVDISFGVPETLIRRTANLTGATIAALDFSYGSAGLGAGDTVVVEASNAAGGPFGILATFTAGVPDTPPPYDLTSYISANTTIRYRVTGGFNATGEMFSIDDVDISYKRAATAVQRTANLTGTSYPVLGFTYGSANLTAGDTLVVEASSAAGGPFTVLATFDGGAPALPSVAPPYTLPPALISGSTTIRFRLTGGFAAANKTFSIDNVDISWGVLSTFASANPPEFLSSSTGCRIRPGGTPVTLTFNATVIDPLPTGLTEITNTASTTSTQFPIAISDSVTNPVVNPSVLSASVGDRVWLDADGDGAEDIGEPGIANVEVTLKDQWGTPVASTITDVNGRYLFPGVRAGNGYYVEVTANTLPGGVTQSFPLTNNRTTTFSLADGQSYTAADLGYEPTATTATFGDLVWVDSSNPGVRDPGEIGIGGVLVELYRDNNSNGQVDAGDTLFGTRTTAPDGSYLFTGVTASGSEDYIVNVPAQAALTGYTATNPPGFRSYPDVSSGGAYLSADFGFQGIGGTTYALRDRVWLDADGAGDFDAGEAGLARVTIELLNASLQVIGTTTTDDDGIFAFSGLAGGNADYTTRITDTAGVLTDYFGTTSYAQARQRAEINLAGNVDHTEAPDSSSYGFLASRSLGDTVFYDLDGNGAQAANESGIAGVVVRLYRDTDDDGVLDGGEPLVGTVTTDANGKYLFSGLSNDFYVVSVPVPSGYTFTGPGTDSDGTPANGIQKGRQMTGANVLDVDYGFQATVPRTLSGTIWNDANLDGVFDGAASGIASVTLDVLSGTTVVATVTTDAAGAYSVSGLTNLVYTVRVTDTNSALTGYAPTFERTELTAAPFDYQESVSLVSGNVANVDFGYARPLPTYAAVAQLRAYLDHGSVTVEWRTSLEVGTVGFHLLRLDPATGEWVQLTDRLVPGLVVHPEGGTYRFLDAGAPTDGRLTYALLEQDVHGRSHPYGPYSVSVSSRTASRAPDAGAAEDLRRAGWSRQAVAPTRMRQTLRATVAAERQVASRRRAERRGQVFKLTTRETGIHFVSAAAMSPVLGLPPARVASLIRTGHLTLSHRGHVVPLQPAASGAGIYFHALPVGSAYTDENAYWVTVTPGPSMSVRTAGPSGILATSFTETRHQEIDRWPLLVNFNDPEGDFWVWDYLYAGDDAEDARSFAIRADGVTGAGDASLTVHLLGGTDFVPGDDHHVQVLFNGAPVGEARWDGLAPFDFGIPLSPSSVLEGDNVVEVRAILDAGVSVSLFYVDSFDLVYERRYEATGDVLSFAAVPGTDVTVGGFSQPGVLLFDVTVPSSPVLMKDYVVSLAGGGRYEVRFGAAGTAETLRYEALLPGRASLPTSLTAWQDPMLRRQGSAADYLLVAPESLAPAARSLAAYRNSRGMATRVVSLEDVYDEFGGGIAEPTAIRTFLRHATSSWSTPPRYVTLVGRGTWDYKDRRGFGDNLVPTLLVGSPDGLVASDVAYADLAGNDGIPEVALGRLPVLTSQDLLDYVAKIQAHESAASGAWQRRVLMTADNADAAGNFPADSESVAALLPPDYTATRVHLDTTTADAGRQAILQAVNDGVVAFNYIGHGGFDRLADENLFTSADVPGLVNAERLTLFLAMTCSVGDFAQPGYPSLGESMLLRKGGGAFAVWAPSGLSQNSLAVRLDQSFFRGAFVYNEKVVGDLVVQGIRELDTPGSEYMRYMYNLLGEPVSRLPE